MDRLRDLIDALRLSRSERNWHLRINPERFRILDIDIQFRTLHEQFQIPEQVRDNEAVHEQLDVLIERHTGLTELGSYNRYKKLSTVYNKEMYNKFLVPVWTSAINEDMSTGYVLYPRLTRLRTVLQELRDARLQSRPYVDEWKKVLRLCMAPIALAVDALHTELPNKRPMYLHHDVCLDNVYMKVRKSTDREGKETVEYDDARLKLTWPSQWSHEFFNHHHHHRELREEGVEYLKRHDWYSFGVYILEVLHVLLDLPFADYTTVNDFVRHVNGLHLMGLLKAHIIEYIDIARRCIELHEDNFERVTRHQMPPDMQERLGDFRELNTFTLYFDYPICPWTAELLWMYEDERPMLYTEYKHFYMAGNEKKAICHACMLSPTAEACTKAHRRDENDRRDKCECDSDNNSGCQLYCFLCYTNGERLFCPNQHGTTSAVLGHSSSFALILHGTVWDHDVGVVGDVQHYTFEEDANMIANCLKHRLIFGMPEANILVRLLNGLTPEALLREYCQEMQSRIRDTGNSHCKVFVFYSGHGNNNEPATAGDWCPSQTDDGVTIIIQRSTIVQCLESINLPHNEVKYVEISCILDCCYPTKDIYVNHVQPRYETRARVSGGQSDITDWLCLLMRSLYYTRCCGVNCPQPCKPEVEDMPSGHVCRVSVKPLDIPKKDRITPCVKITRYIGEELDFLINGECMKYHKSHCEEPCGYHTSLRVKFDFGEKDLMIAYYNQQGVYLKAYPFDEGMDEVEIVFRCKLSCERVKEEIVRKRRSRGIAGGDISLLTNMTDGYSEYELVTDDKLNYIIGSSALFYLVITEPVQVTLTMRRKHDEPVVDKLMLNLDKVDTKQLVSLTHKRRHDDADNDADELRVKMTKMDVEPTVGEGKGIYQLPNLLVYIAHHLWHCRSDKTAQDDLSRALKEGFSRRLVTAGDCKDWRCVESSAKNYGAGKDVKAFDIQQTGDKAISVQWEMDE